MILKDEHDGGFAFSLEDEVSQEEKKCFLVSPIAITSHRSLRLSLSIMIVLIERKYLLFVIIINFHADAGISGGLAEERPSTRRS